MLHGGDKRHLLDQLTLGLGSLHVID